MTSINGSTHYATANAFRRALEDRLKTEATETVERHPPHPTGACAGERRHRRRCGDLAQRTSGLASVVGDCVPGGRQVEQKSRHKLEKPPSACLHRDSKGIRTNRRRTRLGRRPCGDSRSQR